MHGNEGSGKISKINCILYRQFKRNINTSIVIETSIQQKSTANIYSHFINEQTVQFLFKYSVEMVSTNTSVKDEKGYQNNEMFSD